MRVDELHFIKTLTQNGVFAVRGGYWSIGTVASLCRVEYVRIHANPLKMIWMSGGFPTT